MNGPQAPLLTITREKKQTPLHIFNVHGSKAKDRYDGRDETKTKERSLAVVNDPSSSSVVR